MWPLCEGRAVRWSSCVTSHHLDSSIKLLRKQRGKSMVCKVPSLTSMLWMRTRRQSGALNRDFKDATWAKIGLPGQIWLNTWHHMKTLYALSQRVVILDHHKTAFEELHAPGRVLPSNVEVHMDMERSGATIALDYFKPELSTDLHQCFKWVSERMCRYVEEDSGLWKSEFEFECAGMLRMQTCGNGQWVGAANSIQAWSPWAWNTTSTRTPASLIISKLRRYSSSLTNQIKSNNPLN